MPASLILKVANSTCRDQECHSCFGTRSTGRVDLSVGGGLGCWGQGKYNLWGVYSSDDSSFVGGGQSREYWQDLRVVRYWEDWVHKCKGFASNCALDWWRDNRVGHWGHDKESRQGLGRFGVSGLVLRVVGGCSDSGVTWFLISMLISMI